MYGNGNLIMCIKIHEKRQRKPRLKLHIHCYGSKTLLHLQNVINSFYFTFSATICVQYCSETMSEILIANGTFNQKPSYIFPNLTDAKEEHINCYTVHTVKGIYS